ncbi:MAG: hypothetical protein GX348_04715 [Veillonellaceae bacterium]|nr:hypothetical protein [Veillonellaceae bacterium]
MKKMILLSAAILQLTTASAFAWHLPADGSPDKFRPGSTRGYAIWQDKDGVHLVVTTKGKAQTFTGTIKTDGKINSVDGDYLERGDKVKLSKDKEKLNFKLTTAGATDKIDFKVKNGHRLTFDLYVDGRPINANEIYIGNDGIHPSDNTFTLRQ